MEFCARWWEEVKIISQNEQKQKGEKWREKVKLWMDSLSWSEEEADKWLRITFVAEVVLEMKGKI